MPPNLIDWYKVEPMIGKASFTESYTLHAPKPYCPYRVLDVRAIEDSISEVCDGGLAEALQGTDVRGTVEPKKVAGAYPPPYTLIDESVFQQSHHSDATCSWMSQEPLNRDVDYPAPGFRFHLSDFLATPEGGTKEYEFEFEKSKPFDPKEAHKFMPSYTECEPEDLYSRVSGPPVAASNYSLLLGGTKVLVGNPTRKPQYIPISERTHFEARFTHWD